MTIANPAINPSLLADYAARLAATDRAGSESVAQRLRQAASEAGGQFAAGTTITARYRYQVASDGNLVAVQTQITTENADAIAPIGQERAQQGRRRSAREGAQQEERAPGLRDYAPVKPQLAPSEEATLFSALAQVAALPARSVVGFYAAPTLRVRLDTRIAPAIVEDENGTRIEAEVITPGATQPSASVGNAALGFSASFRQAQFSVASLYARSSAAASQPVNTLKIAV